MFKEFLRARDYGLIVNPVLFILGVVLAVLMLRHGIPKLERLLSGDLRFSNPIGLGSIPSLLLTIFAEVICSILVGLGIGTRLATIPLIITMVVVLFVVHASQPLSEHYNALLFLLGYLVLLITGSGKFSLDYYFQRRKKR
jgi:putative oxidoreductase